MKSHGVYETPGGTILRTAHRDLETITLDREVMRDPRLAGASVCRTYLQRFLVLSGTRVVAVDHGCNPENGQRYRSVEALQRELHSRRA